ncbi:MAG: hypothetical protein WCP24_03325 [bacterium]
MKNKPIPANKKNHKIILTVVIIVSIIVAIIGSRVLLLCLENSKITGTWGSVEDSKLQYQFSPFGGYKYNHDISDKKCSIWGCNYEEGTYQIIKSNNKDILILHDSGSGVYSTEFKVDDGYLTLVDGNLKFKKSNQ